MTKTQICVLKTEGGHAKTIRCCIDHTAVTLQTQDESDESKTTDLQSLLPLCFWGSWGPYCCFVLKTEDVTQWPFPHLKF